MKSIVAKPFLKWAGGKGQLLKQLESYYPARLVSGELTRYVEPFVGGGAVFFDLISKFDFKEVVINDVSEELILTYKVIRDEVEKLIEELGAIKEEYLVKDKEHREAMYYQMRSQYNIHKKSTDFEHLSGESVILAAEMIFLNKTCFNGLYRLNSKGEFNVPFGDYKNPTICDKGNLLRVSQALQKVAVLNGDFEALTDFIDDKTFVYFDPPYRPLSGTSSFNSYQKSPFNDESQIRLAKWYRKLHVEKKASLMLSNSDPTNTNPEDTFFEELYAGFLINKVRATRAINSKASQRGSINELLIVNDI